MNNCVFYYLFVIFCLFSGSDGNQYIVAPASQSYRKPVSKCETGSITALVERFFSVIFYEFNNDPPVCVCVQMCVDQPTYCYPNGCLRNKDMRRKAPEHEYVAHAEVEGVIHEKKEDDNKFSFILSENDSRIKNGGVQKVYSQDIESDFDSLESSSGKQTPIIKDVRPNIFKDRYKKLFKYSKIPKVELRYRLNEQIKNMQTDKQRMNIKIPNVAPASEKTRKNWRRYGRGEPTIQMQSIPFSNLNYKLLAFEKKFDELNMINKRDVAKTRSDNITKKTKVNLKSLQQFDDLENVTFSLEKIISEMIENDIENTSGDISKRNRLEDKHIAHTTNMKTLSNLNYNTITKIKEKVFETSPIKLTSVKNNNGKIKRESFHSPEQTDILTTKQMNLVKTQDKKRILEDLNLKATNLSSLTHSLSSNLNVSNKILKVERPNNKNT